MQRIPELELMEDDEQARAYAAADFEAPHSEFIRLFRETSAGEDIRGLVADLGCGPGDIAFRFARAFPRCIVHGVDGSEAMLRHGRERLARESELRGRVEFFHGWLPDAKLSLEKYDAVISNSLLHHLPDPTAMWQSVKQFAKPGAPVFVVDLRRPESVDDAHRLREIYARNEPPILQRDFLNSLLAAFEPGEIAAQLFVAGLRSFTVRPHGDRHIVVSGRMPL